MGCGAFRFMLPTCKNMVAPLLSGQGCTPGFAIGEDMAIALITPEKAHGPAHSEPSVLTTDQEAL